MPNRSVERAFNISLRKLCLGQVTDLARLYGAFKTSQDAR